MKQLANVTAVAVSGRGVLIAGPPGSGKSSLALELIDRGAVLIGDDGVALETEADRLIALPHPETEGLIEIRNVGLVEMATATAPVALLVTLAKDPPRLPLGPDRREIAGHPIPELRMFPAKLALALRVEAGLRLHGLPG